MLKTALKQEFMVNEPSSGEEGDLLFCVPGLLRYLESVAFGTAGKLLSGEVSSLLETGLKELQELHEFKTNFLAEKAPAPSPQQALQLAAATYRPKNELQRLWVKVFNFKSDLKTSATTSSFDFKDAVDRSRGQSGGERNRGPSVVERNRGQSLASTATNNLEPLGGIKDNASLLTTLPGVTRKTSNFSKSGAGGGKGSRTGSFGLKKLFTKKRMNRSYSVSTTASRQRHNTDRTIPSIDSVKKGYANVLQTNPHSPEVMIRSLHKLCQKFEPRTISQFLIYVVSVYDEKPGLIPTKQADHFIQIQDTPIFKSKLQRQNHFITQICEMPVINQAVLDELCTFFLRNSTNLEEVSKEFAPMLFRSSLNIAIGGSGGAGGNAPGLIARVQGKVREIFYSLNIAANYLFPPVQSVSRTRKRLIPGLDDHMKEDEDTIRRKEQLVSFYKKHREDRYLSIVNELFHYYEFKDVMIGIYEKYGVLVDGWREQIKGLRLITQDLNRLDDGADLTNAKFKLLARKPSDPVDEDLRSNDKFVNMKIPAQRIINSEVDYNERLRVFDKFYVQRIKTEMQKKPGFKKGLKLDEYDFELCFGFDFSKVIQLSTDLSVKLETLNLVREPIRRILAMKLTQTEHSVKPQRSKGPEGDLPSDEDMPMGDQARIIHLCDVFLEFIEPMYQEYAPYMSKLNLIQEVIKEHTPTKNTKLLRQPGSEAQKLSRLNTGLSSGTQPSKLQVSYNITGKLKSNDRSNVNLFAGEKRNTRTPKRPHQREKGSLMHSSAKTLPAGGKLKDQSKSKKTPIGIQDYPSKSTNRSPVDRKIGSQSLYLGVNRLGTQMFGGNKNFLMIYEDILKKEDCKCLKRFTLLDILNEPKKRMVETRDLFNKLRIWLDEASGYSDVTEMRKKATSVYLSFDSLIRNFESETLTRDRLYHRLEDEKDKKAIQCDVLQRLRSDLADLHKGKC